MPKRALPPLKSVGPRALLRTSTQRTDQAADRRCPPQDPLQGARFAKMRLVLSSSLLAVLVVTVAESAFEQQQFQTFTRYGKRGVAESEGGRQLFFTNSRYGKRVPGPMGNAARLWSGRPKGNVQPRADKFFINSRYGKRSSPSPQSTTKEQIYPELTESTADVYSDAATGRALECSFTGYNQLYHCTERHDAVAAAAGDSANENQSIE